jgi:three-Cys-motif partner protein
VEEREGSRADLRNEIGPWSEVKLEIIREYANAYSRILNAQTRPRLYHVYIDAFAGAGNWVSRLTREPVAGSPTNVLETQPPFRKYHFIDLDELRVSELERIAGDRPDVSVCHGDANAILVQHILPEVRWEDYRRGLCLLDPYGIHYSWSLVEQIGKMRSIDLFLNFPIMDINRNALRRDAGKIDAGQEIRMTDFWGDSSWRQMFYTPNPQMSLFGETRDIKSFTNEQVVDAYIQRLRRIAGFQYIPKPMPMRNSSNAEVYYLLFAAHKEVAGSIVEQIFDKYRSSGA